AEVVREVLPSGARVLLLREPSVPLVAMRAAWIGGLRDETPEVNGVSNLLAALITRGTETRTGDQIAYEIESLAGGIGGVSGRHAWRPPPPPRDDPPDHAIRVRRYLNKQQAHLVVGFPGTTIGDPDRFTLEVLSTILSGQGGRLFVELRERRGLAYRVSAFTL